MNATFQGILIGALVAVFALNWGLSGLIVGGVFMAVGAVLGRATTGKLDLKGVWGALTGRNSTSSE